MIEQVVSAFRGLRFPQYDTKWQRRAKIGNILWLWIVSDLTTETHYMGKRLTIPKQ